MRIYDQWLSVGERTEHPGAYILDIRRGIGNLTADIRALPFGVKSMRGVELFHVLEHLTMEDGIRALLELRRVMRPMGVLLIAVPDMEKCAQSLLDGNLLVLNNIYSSGPPAQLHRWGYTSYYLAQLLKDIGFDFITRLEPHSDDPHEVRFAAYAV